MCAPSRCVGAWAAALGAGGGVLCSFRSSCVAWWWAGVVDALCVPLSSCWVCGGICADTQSMSRATGDDAASTGASADPPAKPVSLKRGRQVSGACVVARGRGAGGGGGGC